MNKPLRREIWLTRLDPTEGHELSKTRPCLIISHDRFNKSAADLVVVLPLTSKNKQIPLHVLIAAGSAGLTVDSFVMPEQIRSLSIGRCIKYLGKVEEIIFKNIEQKIKTILDIR